MDCALTAMKLAGYEAPVSRLLDMPSGVLNRVADSSRAMNLLGWEATIPFAEGMRRTYEWYASNKDAADVADLVSNGDALLTHRASSLRPAT
jgi:nucleoside-diphosphate-sugar epimerase